MRYTLIALYAIQIQETYIIHVHKGGRAGAEGRISPKMYTVYMLVLQGIISPNGKSTEPLLVQRSRQ